MKKLMSAMLGLSLILGSASLFAQDTATKTKTEKTKKTKKTKKSKTDKT